MINNIIRKLKGLYKCNYYIINFLKYGFDFCNSKNVLSYRILILVHALEKGVGLKDCRLGFGQKKINDIMQLILEWEHEGYPNNDFCYVYSINILKYYLDFHKKHNYYNLFIEQINTFIENRVVQSIETGYIEYNPNFDRNNFLSLIQNRHSIRDYSDKDVPRETILKCIEIATLSPSACNRQSTKVYFSMKREIIKKIGEYIPGNTGFTDVNNYLVITADVSAYATLEYMQWMTNAGIFLTYLSLALENIGICNCILQWANINDSEPKLRKLLKIPNNEQVVAAISIGYPTCDSKVLRCKRKLLKDIYNEI